MENRKIRVAITHGDTNGIGYELIFKAFDDPVMLELCTPIIYGSPKIASYHRNILDLQTDFSIISHANEARDGRINLLPTFDDEIKVEIGTPTEKSGNAGLKAIDRALDDYQQGFLDVLVTAPINNNEAFHFSGQSRYIEDHLDQSGKGLLILVNDMLRVALATWHLPLKQVVESITKDTIMEKTAILHTTLRRDFRISNPRIAILALNPKAGKNGLLGIEEKEIIMPAIQELAENGIQAFGPYAADEFWGNGLYGDFDGILAMYYDQGSAPFRTLTIGGGVSMTAGLPLICMAPEHGAAFDIAGQNKADETSFRQSIYLALDVFRHRAEYDEPLTNPLKKLFKERRDESEKVRFTVPKKETKDEQIS